MLFLIELYLLMNIFKLINSGFKSLVIISAKKSYFLKTIFILILSLLFIEKSLGQSYCDPSHYGAYASNYIKNVTIAGIDKTTSGTDGVKQDYTGDTDGAMTQGVSYAISISTNKVAWVTFLSVYIDWNDDGDWDDASETVVDHYNLGYGSGTSTYTNSSYTCPSIGTGTVRMRVINSLYNNYGPCTNWDYGEFEDYEIVVSSGCSVGSASSSPSVAKDNAMTNITHATSGVTGVTSSSGLPSGVTASYSSDVLTISGTPTATGTFNYTIDLDGCGDDATGTITVTSCAGNASSSPTVALNTAMTNITHTTTGVSGITSSSGLPSGVTASYSSNTLTISGTPTATGTFNYTIDLTGCSDDATGTITVFAPTGGVSDDLHLWLKADAQTFSDAGSTASTDGTEVQEWHDQSSNSFDATDNGGTGPDWDEDALNFNPGIDFVSASSEDLEIANGILESENKSSLFHYYVLKVDESQNNGLFRENLGGSNYYEALFWASGSWYGSYGNNVSGEGRIVQDWGANHGEWHLWGWGTSNNVYTPNSTRRYLMRDNTVIDSDKSTTNVGGTGQNNTFYLGSRAAGSYLDGTLC